MAPEGLYSMLAASVVDNVFQQQGARFNDIDMASRKAEEAVARRYEAAGWLRRTVGVVAGKELPEEPTEEEFRLGLRSGFILCSALNKVKPGTIPKVVACPEDSVDESALAAYQYFENIRNYLVSAQEMGIPVFEASDLEKGGKSARVVNSVLALKSYNEWRQAGGNGFWKYGGNLKPSNTGKFFVRKNLEPFSNSLSRTSSLNENFLDVENNHLGKLPQESLEMTASSSLGMLLGALRSEQKSEEGPKLVESMLEKVMGLLMKEFEHRVSSQTDMVKIAPNETVEHSACSPGRKVLAEVVATPACAEMVSDENIAGLKEDDVHRKTNEDKSRWKLEKWSLIFEQQQKDILELKHMLHATRSGIDFMHMKCSEDLCNLRNHFQSLTHAASGYHKVLEENRKLYNQIQDMKGSIRVYCRVRPFLPGQSSATSTIGHLDDGSITIVMPSKNGKEGRRSFSFNKIFRPSATQDEVFSDTRPLIRSVLDGYNVCIFAYGQTGSGKTYTMTGPKNITNESQGVNYRALNDLFSLTEQRGDTFCYDVSVQMIEIYNEQVRDLLANDGQNRKLEIRNNSQKDLNVPDANLVSVATTSDVIELMNVGQRNRAVSMTALNDRSSRSHSCLTVHLQGKDIASGTILRGRMHLIDLAGSERVNKSEVTGERLREAQHINKSLSALGDVIAALAQKNPHVPYRNSKLTQLLQDSLGGQAKTLMFVHISPEVDATEETISTLKFAERVSTVELGAARLNKENSEVKMLKEQIASLKEALASKNGGSQNLPNMMTRTGILKNNSSKASPLHPNIQNGVGGTICYRQLSEDAESTRTEDDSSKGKKNLNSNQMEVLPKVNDLPSWLNNNSMDDKNDTKYDDWVDKVMVNNKLEIRDDDSLGDWSEEAGQLTEFFYQKYLPDMRAFSVQQSNGCISRTGSLEFGSQRTQSESAITDESDEFDVATIDSTETDILCQFNNHSFTTSINENISTKKKSQTRPPERPEIRNRIQTYGPSPSRKASSGSLQTPPSRAGRRPTGVKRELSSGKLGRRK